MYASTHGWLSTWFSLSMIQREIIVVSFRVLEYFQHFLHFPLSFTWFFTKCFLLFSSFPTLCSEAGTTWRVTASEPSLSAPASTWSTSSSTTLSSRTGTLDHIWIFGGLCPSRLSHSASVDKEGTSVSCLFLATRQANCEWFLLAETIDPLNQQGALWYLLGAKDHMCHLKKSGTCVGLV